MNRLADIIDDLTLLRVLEESPFGVLISDQEGRVIYAGKKTARLLACRESDLLNAQRDRILEKHQKEKQIWGEVKALVGEKSTPPLFTYTSTIESKKGPLTIDYLIEITPAENGNSDLLNACLVIESGKVDEETDDESIDRLRMEHLLYQSGPVIIFNWKAEDPLPILYVTKNISQLGYEAEEFIKNHQSYRDLIFPEDRKRVLEAVKQNIEEGKNSFEQTYRIVTANGMRIWAYDYTTIVRDSEGNLVSYLAYILDITEIKYLETALRNREEKYRLISENMQDLITLHDPDWAYRYVSNSVESLLGYAPEELLGSSPLDMIHPRDIKRIMDDIRKLDELNLPGMRFQYRMKKADGSYTWFETILNPIHDETGSLVQLQAASRDISSQKLMEKQVRSLVKFPEENPHPVIRTTSDGEIIYANRASNSLVEYWENESGRDTMLPDYWVDIIHDVIENKNPRSIENSIKESYYLFSVTPVPEENETYIYGIDISEKHRQEKELYLTARIFETTLEGITVTDKEGTIQSINPAFTRITGYSKEEVLGANPRILKSDRHDRQFYQDMWESISEHGAWEGEIWNRRKSGETYPEWLSINAIYNDVGQVQNYVAVFTDISEIKVKEEKIEYQAFHDPLTGLPNRNLLNDRLEVAIHRSSRSEKGLALVYIDLDRFKYINDSLGHVTGDFLLMEIAQRLQHVTREDDTIARVGGDEFVLLLSEIDDFAEITTILSRVSESFIDPVIIDSQELFITPSIGISLYPQDGTTATEIFKNADIAMYETKKKGGNGYHFYAEEMDYAVTARLRIENRLHHAIKDNEFKIHYQPLVDLKTGEIAGAEALIRWESKKLGSISPADFIPLAEEMGLIVQINDFTMKQACEDNAKLQELGLPDIYFSINMTAQQFFQGRIIDTIRRSLSESGLQPRHVAIEITENTLMDNAERTVDIMNEIREMGIRFSIDDFGTGYSSLSYLRRFPLDTLKIDKSFVDDLPHDEESAAITRTIIALAHSLNLKTVAEGVERAEQLKLLREAGVDYIQGYYFSRPVTFEKLVELLKKGPFLEGLS